MKIFLLRNIIAVIWLALFCNGAALASETTAKPSSKPSIVVGDVGFSMPESVEYYATEDVYLVTNINGNPFAADGTGFISKIKPDGSVVALKWIDGSKKGITLNAPKGAAIHRNKLYVADINQVQIFELPSGKQMKSITIKGSTFLNGITPGKGNYIYISDSGFSEGFLPSGTDAIYKVWGNGQYKAVAKNKDMGHPNGILEDGNKLIVVTVVSGQVMSIDMTGKQTVLSTPPTGSLDGLLKLKDGRFLISSWDGSAIYAMNKNQAFSILASPLDAPADLGFDTKRNRVLVPLFKQNKVIFLPL